jgi:uncharacterized small protein (DUF1192 family)
MMEVKDIIQWVILLIVAAGGWFFALYRDWVAKKEDEDKEARSLKQQKIDKVEEYLNALAEIQELYRFFARKEENIERDENGAFVVDGSGAAVIEERILEPEERFEFAIQALEKTDIRSAIAQSVVKARRTQGEVSDIALELDPSGELNKRIGILQWRTISLLESHLQRKSFDGFVTSLKEATVVRREIRSMLSGLL